MDIKNALLKLDPENKDHWTGDGLPKVDALGIPGIKRADITNAAPQFTRDNPTLDIKETENADEEGIQQEENSNEETFEEENSNEEKEVTLEDKKKQLEFRIAELNSVLSEVQRELDETVLDYDNTIDQLTKENAGRSTQHDIMAFIESQKRQRAERVARMTGAAPVQFKSPLDEALGAKNNRPTRGTKVDG